MASTFVIIIISYSTVTVKQAKHLEIFFNQPTQSSRQGDGGDNGVLRPSQCLSSVNLYHFLSKSSR